MVHIEVKQLVHKGMQVMLLQFPKNDLIIQKLRTRNDVRWSNTHKSWYLPASGFSLSELTSLLSGLAQLKGDIALNKVGPVVLPAVKEQTRISDRMQVTWELHKAGVEKHVKHIERFMQFLRSQRYSESTVENYSKLLKTFLSYYSDRDTAQLTYDDVLRFNNEIILKYGYSVSHQRQLVGAMKLFFALVPDSNMEVQKLERPRRGLYLPVVLSKEEVSAILEHIINIKHRCIIALIYASGLRIGELLNLKLSDVDSRRMLIRVHQGKGGKDRYVSLSEKILIMLRNYYDEYKPVEYLFNGAGGERYSPESIRNILKVACERAGIRKKVTPHTLRHSYATHMLEQGVDLRYVQELLGHAKPETTMIYTHVTQKKLISIKSPFDVMYDKERDWLRDLGNRLPEKPTQIPPTLPG